MKHLKKSLKYKRGAGPITESQYVCTRLTYVSKKDLELKLPSPHTLIVIIAHFVMFIIKVRGIFHLAEIN